MWQLNSIPYRDMAWKVQLNQCHCSFLLCALSYTDNREEAVCNEWKEWAFFQLTYRYATIHVIKRFIEYIHWQNSFTCNRLVPDLNVCTQRLMLLCLNNTSKYWCHCDQSQNIAIVIVCPTPTFGFGTYEKMYWAL